MPAWDYPFIHPLLGSDDDWAGYRVEFSPGSEAGPMIARLAASPILNEFDHRAPWFIPAIAPSDGMGEPDDRAITTFPARTNENTLWVRDLEAQLRQSKRKVGLEASPEEKLPGAGTWDYLLLSAGHARGLPPYTLLGISTRTTIVVTDVHSHSDHSWSLANACSLSTGEYLLTHSTGNTKADMSRLKLVKLLALIDDDANTSALEEVFREEPKLSYSLLRLVNSAALAPATRITSYAQAINILGRRQLQRWLQLLVYSDLNDGRHPTPLLQKAAARGFMMEALLPRVPANAAENAIDAQNHDDTAFMIGTFSLLDVLLNIPMGELLHQLPLTEYVEQSLLRHKTPAGLLLDAIEAAEKRDLSGASRRLRELSIDAETYLDVQLAALSWAAKIRKSV